MVRWHIWFCHKYVSGKIFTGIVLLYSLRWRHNGLDSVSNHQPPGCLLNRLFRRKSKKTSKLRVTGLCAGNSPGTGEFSAQMASYAENVSIWWRHHVNRFLHRRVRPCIYPYLLKFRQFQWYEGVIEIRLNLCHKGGTCEWMDRLCMYSSGEQFKRSRESYFGVFSRVA